MVKANILINKRDGNETIYELTEEGLENIRLWNKSLARFFRRHELRRQDWTGKWYFLSILDFNKSEYENLFILEELERCGLREVNNNIWVTPYNIDNDIFIQLEHQKFNYLKFSGSFESNLNLNTLLIDTFQLNKIRKKYIKFIDKVRKGREKMNAVDQGNTLPILFETRWDFYDIVTSDPALPKELLELWEGDNAVDEMNMIRSELFKKIVDFFEGKNA
jgi:DNA-binding transcriptional regulator PaaX